MCVAASTYSAKFRKRYATPSGAQQLFIAVPGATKPAAGSVAKISGKAAALEMALSQITRSHGKVLHFSSSSTANSWLVQGALMRLDSKADLDDLVVTSTGSLG